MLKVSIYAEVGAEMSYDTWTRIFVGVALVVMLIVIFVLTVTGVSFPQDTVALLCGLTVGGMAAVRGLLKKKR